MAEKRKLEEFDASDVQNSKGATVHGIVTDLSPVKKSKKNEKIQYFKGELSDDKGCVRIISFEPSMRQPLYESLSKKSPISVVNCEVRDAREGGQEILVSNTCKIQASPKKFDVTTLKHQEPTMIQMNDVPSLAATQLVTVTIKAKTVDTPERIKNKQGKELSKQDCIVGDSSGCGRLVLWEQDVGKIAEDKSYKIIGAKVNTYKGVNYLSLAPESQIELIDDIGVTVEIDSDDLQERGIVKKVVLGQIDGVLNADQYEACMKCNSKVNIQDDLIAECTKCDTLMRRSRCTTSATAKVLVTDSKDDEKTYTLTMFADIINQIIDTNSTTNIRRALLATPPLKFNVDTNNVVYSVQIL